MSYFIELKKLPAFVKEITFEYVMFCEQVEYSYKRTISYHQHHKNAHGWGYCAVKRFMPNNQRYKSLHFGCQIDIIHIKYNDDKIKEYGLSHLSNIISPIPSFKQAKFEWKIDGKVLEKFKNATIDEFFYSENFGDNYPHWFLMCKPFGSKFNHTQNRFILALRLSRIPFGMNMISVQYDVTVDGDGELLYNLGQIRETLRMNGDWKHLPITLFDSSQMKDLSTLSIVIIVKLD